MVTIDQLQTRPEFLIFFIAFVVEIMASRLASLRTTLQQTTEAVVRDGAKIAEYRGPSIGAGTSGNYGNLPRPMPASYFFKQEYNLKWLSMIACSFIFIGGAFVPVWAIPFYRKTSRDLKKVDEEFGPTKYGVGKRFFI